MSYKAKWAKGSAVKIVSLSALEQFRNTWKFHDPLQPDQLQYAANTARVASVGYYHGGDVLYQLEDIPGTWHECCLEPPP